MNKTLSAQTTAQQAKQGEALLERLSEKQQASNAQLFIALFVMLLVCGLAFEAKAAKAANADDATSIQRTDSLSDEKSRWVKSSRFCIFGVDDLKLRPSAARGDKEKRSPAHLENGDCWMDKPGQVA